MSFLGGMHNEKSIVKAEVEEDSEILFLPMDKVTLFIKEYPEWLDYIFRLYHKRFEELLYKKSEISQSKTIVITHEQLVNELGTVRVVVSRLLKQLEDSGKLKLGRNKIILSDFIS